MKHLKMLGLAAVAALGLMAFVGAGTASATTLATDAAGTVSYGVGTEFDLSLKTGTSGLLEKTNGEKIATTTISTIKWTIATATGTWVAGNINTMEWGGTSQTTDTLSAGSLEIMQLGMEDKGEIISKGMRVTYGVFGVSCVYGSGAGTKLGTINGGQTPELVISASLPRIEGSFLCPSSSIWTATYIVTSPHALHFVE